MKPKFAMAAARMALNCRSIAWGLHPAALAALVAVAAGELSVEDMPEEARPHAQRGGSSTTGGVAVIPLRGLITPRPSFLSLLFGGGGGLMGFRAALRESVASDDITAIIIDVDSPGGSTDLLVETAAEIRNARSTKPVVAVANTWAASAAYWLAAQADELIVTPTGEVGSIGIFTAHEDWSQFEENFGVHTTLISAGKYKTEGNQFEPLSEEARAAIQAVVDEYYDMFVSDVAAGRGVSAGAIRGGYGEGRMVPARQALAESMVDSVDTLEATIARMVRNPPRPRGAAAEKDPQGNPQPNSPKAKADPPEPEVDEEAVARTRARAVDLLTAPLPSI